MFILSGELFERIGTPLGMAVPKCKTRLVADPSIGVGDLLSCVEKHVENFGVGNFASKLQPPPNTGWKTAPQPGWLALLSPLWKEYLKIAPNGVLPSKKHGCCLEKLQEKREMPGNKRTKEENAEKWDEWVRIGLAQLRSLQQSDQAKARAMRKADGEEQAKLEEVLSLLQVDAESIEHDPVHEPQEQTQALDQPTLKSEEPVVLRIAGEASSEAAIDPLAVFSMVLQRPSFEDGKSEANSKQSTGSVSLRKTPTPQNSFDSFLTGLIKSGNFKTKDADLLIACAEQEPVNKGYSSQLQRANKQEKTDQESTGESQKQNKKGAKKGKEKGHGKGKGKGKGCGKAPKLDKKKKKKSQEKCQKGQTKNDQENADLTQEGQGGAEAVPQPEGPGTTKKEVKVGGKKNKQDTKRKSNEDGKKVEEWVPEGFDAQVSRAVNRKRFTSRRWHQGYDAAIHEGLGEEEAKKRARESSQAASKEFVNLWPSSIPDVD